MINTTERIDELKLDHKLKVKRIVLEKLLLGAVVGLFSLLANMVLQNYQSELVKNQHLFELRTEAIEKLLAADSVLTAHIYMKINEKTDYDPEQHRKDVHRMMEMEHLWAWLLGDDFHDAARRYIRFHEACARQGIKLQVDQWEHFQSIEEWFSERIARAVASKITGESSSADSMPSPFISWSDDVIVEKGLKAYFEENMKAWNEPE